MKKITWNKKRVIPILFFLFFTAFGFSQSSQTFVANGTFNVPAGITTVQVEVWGGGGKGGTRSGSNGACGGGGGGGYSRKLVTVSPSTGYPVTVGLGSTTTAAGGSSFFINNTTVLARGGNSVIDNSNPGAAGAAVGIGDVTYTGGNGASGINGNRSGGGGSSAGSGANGVSATNQNGAAAPANGGDGGDGRTSQGNGTAGSDPGAGGGGGYRSSNGTRAGGSGGDGQVIISWGPEIGLFGNSVAIADGDNTPSATDHTDFGTTGVTIGTIVRTFTIQNTGIHTLSISGVAISGANAGDFSVTTSPAASVSAGGGITTFQVTFDPSASGVRNATITITSNDADEASYDFAITGSGATPEVNVTGNSVSIPDNDVTAIPGDWTDFGTIHIAGPASITRIFTIQNTGADDLTIAVPTLTGSADFTITTFPAATVPAGGTTTIGVTFDPTVTGVKTTVLSFGNNDSNENPYNFTLSGTAMDPEITVRGNGNNITNGDATPSLTDFTDFGPTNITSGTVSRAFTIHNISVSASTLNIGTITITGANAADFSITATPAATLTNGNSTPFTVLFNPSTVGVKTAIINIPNNDNDENPYTYTITGTGTDCEIDVQGNGLSIAYADNSPSATDATSFGSTDVLAGTLSNTYTIFNGGTATMNLTVGTITFFGAAAADFSITALPAASVAPGASTTFTVAFNPSASGVRNAIINIPNNDGNEAPYNFSITGTGIDGEIDVTGNAISIVNNDATPSTTDNTDFGATDITNGLVSKTFTVSNMGTATMPLTLGAVTFAGANPGEFFLTTPLGSTNLAIGASTTFTVTFNPSTTGVKNATVNIANNDSNENPYIFAITGTGTDPEINLTGNLVTIADGDTTPSVSDFTDFGTVSIDAGSTLVNYTIQNTGVGTMTIGSITFTGADASNFSVTISPSATLASGASTTFQVSFNPITPGAKNAVLTIANNDSNENPYDFNITGLGVRTYPDTDGDNVSDNIDIDDDNDGIIDTMEQSNCVALPLSLSSEYTFLNETFGAGTTKGLININIPGATCTYCYEDGIVGPNTVACPSQSSWILDDGEYVVVHKIAGTVASDPENIHGDLAWNGLEDHTVGDTNGRMAVFNASFAAGTFYETTVSGIIPNVPITYSFWAMNILSASVYSGSILPNISVEFLDLSNNVISTFNTGNLGRCTGPTSNNSCAQSVWQQFTTSVNLGNNTAFIIRFRNNAPGGGGNDLAIDDITIKQSYCDRDGDGVANIFDLDSDNDGIPDVEEAGFKALTAGKGIMNLASGVWLDANANGLHDNIDAMIAGATYVLSDTDGDGSRDFVDLDSDNDSLFDVDESGLLNGDGDIDGDGIGDGADVDGDGFLNIFDTFLGQGTATRPFAANTDSAGNPDYMSIDSNNDAVFDITPTLYASLDANNNGILDGSTDADRDGITDTFDTTLLALGSPRDLNRKLYLDFDGRNDYAEGTQLLSGLGTATIMGWVKLTSPFSANSFIIGQDNFNLKIDAGSGIKLTTTAKGVTITYATNLSVNRWYHIAAVYDGSNATEKLRLYLNGNQVVTSNSGTLAGALATSTANFTMGKNATASNQFFKGAIEEVRAFNTALTTDQVQKMVYQEIKQNGTAVRGEIIPKDIEFTSWPSLLAYYRMDAYKDDVIDDYTTGTIDAGTGTFARIYNVKNIRYQLAPMPFVTTAAGVITSAVAPAGSFINGQDVLDNAWSIVNIKHNINLNFNMTNLGTFIDPSVNLVLNNDNQLRNTWYLRLNGKIDLQGRSQLVQTAPSDLDPTSAGFIERDQQGTTNRFNYNYWSSPVGAINATTNNNAYTVAGNMKDGTNAASPQNILWTTGLNSASTSPITLSSYWIFKFQNVNDSYANWASVGPNGSLLPGQGFTLKGSNAATPTQNYVFTGKPHNGPITSPIAANNLNLSGNPYASAIDANQFITDNLASLNGTIYFWEHFSTNTTHNLADYQGGYAARTLVGGTPPVSPSEVSGLGSSSRTPGRFIPVGQGFFVTGSGTGGTITFNNGQRAFIRENDANSNAMFRQSNPVVDAGEEDDDHHGHNNNQDVYEEDTYAKIRLGFNSANNYHRQTLLGFMDDKATPGMDIGYDAKHIDVQPNDMYYMLGSEKLTIQGDDYFNTSDIFPIGVKTAAAGNVSFIVDATENFDEAQQIFIYDNVTSLYHNIKEEKFEIALPAATINDRFSLRFSDGSLGVGENNPDNGMFVAYSNANSSINIKNNLTDATAKSVTLYNMLGQSITAWDVENQDQLNITLPVKDLSTGTYIVKIKTTKGDISKKIVVR